MEQPTPMQYLVNKICTYNPKVKEETVEKILNKYSSEDVERVADAVYRFGVEAIFADFVKV